MPISRPRGSGGNWGGTALTGQPQRMIRRIPLVSGTVVVILAVLLSPYFLGWMSQFRGTDWSRLSQIGQTYGAASAVLSALALIGISVSVLVQARHASAEQVASVRTFHRELLMMTAEDPQRHLATWGYDLREYSVERQREGVFAHMIMTYAGMAYRVRVTDEHQLRRVILAHFFNSEVSRLYWEIMAPDWIQLGARDKRIWQFFQIVQDEYEKAVAAGPPSIPMTPLQDDHSDAGPHATRSRGRTYSLVLAGTACGILAGTTLGVLGRRRRA